MKVSEAIEAGIKLVPVRCEGAYFKYEDSVQDRVVAACVLGTAACGQSNSIHRMSLSVDFDDLFSMVVHPVNGDMPLLTRSFWFFVINPAVPLASKYLQAFKRASLLVDTRLRGVDWKFCIADYTDRFCFALADRAVGYTFTFSYFRSMLRKTRA